MLDLQQIKQVLLNLFLNAMDAIGECGGALRVRTSRVMTQEGNAWVQIEVEDTGCGIPAANLERIFDPFFTTKHKSGENEGTGLGLAIAHQIIQEHRGEIQVRSAEGVGTTFRINLPSFV
jgi:signal transduction histidine kinase